MEGNPRVLVQIGRDVWETQAQIIRAPEENERVLHKVQEKYGRMVPLFYHLDRLTLVAFRVDGLKCASDECGSR